MTILDWVLIFLIISFVFSGFKMGFIYSFGSLLGVILGTFVAGKYYESAAGALGSTASWSNVLIFILIFLTVSRLIGFIFYIINKAFKIIAIIPFLGLINRMGGALLGFIEGTLFLGVIIYFLSRIAVANYVTNMLGGSALVSPLVKIGSLLAPLLPDVIKNAVSII